MKYLGSKQRIAKYIVPILQNCINNNDIKTYYEPFVGGANVINKIKCQCRVGSDLNKYLIGLLNHVKNGGELLDSVSKELYSEVRSKYKTGIYEDWYVGNIGFLASYNGRWFDGGYANSGYEGKRYRDYYTESKNNLMNQAMAIRNVEFYVNDYKDLEITPRSMVYCDAPYKNKKQYENSTHFDYVTYWNWIREISVNNYVIVSEENAPSDFVCIWSKPVSRSIKAKEKTIAIEKLFTYSKGLYMEELK